VVNSFDRHLTTGERNYSQSKIPYAWTWIRNKPEICFNIPLIKKHKLTKAKIISMICHEIFHVYNFPVSENFTSPIPTKYSNYPPEFWAEFFEDWCLNEYFKEMAQKSFKKTVPINLNIKPIQKVISNILNQ
jgi:hypothetical protein